MRLVFGTLALFFVLVGTAPAAVSVRVLEGSLEIVGTEASEAVTLTEDGGTITVASPQGVEGCTVCAVGPNATVTVLFGAGEDTLRASTLTRSVTVRADSGGDEIYTGAGDDPISVVETDNVVHAGPGDDVLTGAGELYGEAGDDWLNGGGRLMGGPGNDRVTGVLAQEINGGPGEDVLEGSVADDTFLARDGEPDVVACGDGTDTVLADRVDDLTGCERPDFPPVQTPVATVTPTATFAPPPASPPPSAPAGPVLPAARDTLAPTVNARMAKRLTRSRFYRSGVRATVRCSETCSVTVEVRVSKRDAKRLKLPRLLARGTGAGRVTAKPGAAVRRKLKRVKRAVRAQVTIRAVDAAGNARTVRRTLKLSR